MDTDQRTVTRAYLRRLASHYFEQGRLYERNRIAEGVADLRESWVAPARRTYEQRIAERIESMRGAEPPPPLVQTPDWPPIRFPGAGQ